MALPVPRGWGRPAPGGPEREAGAEGERGPRLHAAMVRFAGFASVFSDSLSGEGREVTIFSLISKF